MKLDFNVLQLALTNHFNYMLEISNEIFYVELPQRNTLVDLYLGSFPEGTNPIRRERPEHDCNCCRSFIRQFGNMVVISKDTGGIISLWDFKVDDPNYQVVVDEIAREVNKYSIANVFRSESSKCGVDYNYEMVEGGDPIKHSHFFLNMPREFVMKESEYGPYKGKRLADKEVLERSIGEISSSSVEIVIDIIEQGSLYRGEEHLNTVKTLKVILEEFDQCPLTSDTFSWLKSAEIGSTGRIKNTVIGQLLYDISLGTDLEVAVKKYESMVAPSNYKRPKALVTQKMVDKAQEDIDKLGLNNSFSRRYANASDLTINNVLFADGSVQPSMSGGVFDVVKPNKSGIPNLDKVEEITIKDFLYNVLPKAESLEVMVENSHKSNFVSVIAPSDPTAPSIMKWGNPFSWSYNGEVTDSLKEHVKSAGGDVEGDLRFSIKWNDEDSCMSDLDAHCETPMSHIYYPNKNDGRGGKLDVDIMSPKGVAVENITFEHRSKMVDGQYKFSVKNYEKRSGRSSFKAQIEFDGQTLDYHYDADLGNEDFVNVAIVELKNNTFSIVSESLTSSKTSCEIWGVETLKWTPLEMILNSPNHWGGEETGNKHYFFILKDCLNPEDSRGFYNEFLRDDLTEHRKSFEVLGSKLKAKSCNNQLSGLGFSSTQRNELVVKVKGSFNRVMKIKF